MYNKIFKLFVVYAYMAGHLRIVLIRIYKNPIKIPKNVILTNVKNPQMTQKQCGAFYSTANS